jgi:hypothetical protein
MLFAADAVDGDLGCTSVSSVPLDYRECQLVSGQTILLWDSRHSENELNRLTLNTMAVEKPITN